MRVFLSHSSNDKKRYVDYVAKNMSTDEIIIDQRSFIPGRLSTDEMQRLISDCDIFVLFISNSSLKNDNVKFEIEQYKESLFERSITFIPLIIEDGIKYDDFLIPIWMREYNLKRVTRPRKAIACIDEVIRIKTWDKYDFIKKKDSIFRGRNELIDKFEMRFSDRSLGKPVCYFASGLESIGRKAFLAYCFRKVGKIRKEYEAPTFTLSSTESIEDFIFKMDELGISETVDVSNLSSKSIAEKVQIALNLLNSYHENDELVHIVDNGCIITNQGKIADWFNQIITFVDNKIIGARLFISSRFNCYTLPSPKIWCITVPELSHMERQWLLEAYLELFEVHLTDDEFSICLNWLQGYPLQVLFLAQSLSEQSFEKVKERSKEIVDFNMNKIDSLLARYSADEKKMTFLATLAKLELAKTKDITSAFGDTPLYKDLITELLLLSICVNDGITNEYIRLSDTVKDYLNRKRFKIDDTALKKFGKKILSDFSNDEHGIPDSSELYFYMHNAITHNVKNIESKYIFPSHFAKCLKEIYNKRGHDNDVIKLAEHLISKKDFIDGAILKTAYYYLCLALARKRNSRVLIESNNLDLADKHFVRGFYFRKDGRWLEAISELNSALTNNPRHRRAKRELVIAYIRREEYSKAFKLAKDSYEEDRANTYFAQAYFKCLMSQYLISRNHEEGLKLKEIIDGMIVGDDERDRSMQASMKAEYQLNVMNNKNQAYEIIDECLSADPYNIHTLFSKFNIAEKLNDARTMKEVQGFIREFIKDLDQHEDVLTRNDILITAHEGNTDTALDTIESLSDRFSDSFKQKLRDSVYRIRV